MGPEAETLDVMEEEDFGTPVIETPEVVEETPEVVEEPVTEETPEVVETEETPEVAEETPEPAVEELSELEQLRADNARLKLDHEDLASRFETMQTPTEEAPEAAPTEEVAVEPMFSDEEFEAAMIDRGGMEVLATKMVARAQAQSLEQMNQIVPQLIAQGVNQELQRMQSAQKTEQFFQDNPELRAEAKRVDLIANQLLKEDPELTKDPEKFMTTVRDESYKRLGIRRSTVAPPAPRGARTRRAPVPEDPRRKELDELDDV